MRMQVWLPIAGDNGDTWPVVSSCLLDSNGAHDFVRVFNRGALAGELTLALGDGIEFMKRLGLEKQP